MESKTKIQQLFKAIREGRADQLKDYYPLYRDAFVQWGKRFYSVTEDDLLDVYQDAFIVFYKKVVSGQLIDLDSSMKTYLFAIGKRMLLKRYQQNKRIELMDEEKAIQLSDQDDTIHDKIERDHRQQLIRDSIDQLGEVCQRILRLFYFERFSTEAIKIRLGYKDVTVVRSQKLRCMKRLRAIVIDKTKNNEF